MLIRLYESVLAAANLVVNNEGLISMDLCGVHSPCTVGKDPAKRLVLPTPAVLANPNWATTIAFHPLSESLLRGESEVLRKLKALLMMRVLGVVSDLSTQLMAIAVNVEAQKKLTPDQHEFLSLVGPVSENTFKDLSRINESLGVDRNQLINMYLKRAGQWKGKGYSRVAVTTFPLLAELATPGKEVFGINLGSQKNKKAIKALFDYILPGNEDADKYSYGSNNDVAPYFHAMMSSFVKIAKQLNSITKKFKKHLDEPESLMIDVEFDKDLNDLGKFRDIIPSLSGNEGVSLDKSGEEAKVMSSDKVVVLDTSVGKKVVQNALASIESAEVPIQQPVQQVAVQQPVVQNLPWNQAPVQQVPVQQPVQAPAATGTVTFDQLLQQRVGAAVPTVMPVVQMGYQQAPVSPQQMFMQQFGQVQQPTPMVGYNQFQQPGFIQQPMYPTGI